MKLSTRPTLTRTAWPHWSWKQVWFSILSAEWEQFADTEHWQLYEIHFWLPIFLKIYHSCLLHIIYFIFLYRFVLGYLILQILMNVPVTLVKIVEPALMVPLAFIVNVNYSLVTCVKMVNLEFLLFNFYHNSPFVDYECVLLSSFIHHPLNWEHWCLNE